MAGPVVLLCDDAQGFHLMLGTLLADAGFDVSFASTWEDAVACATEQQPDAILVDLWMPTYDPALLRGLRACSSRSVVVVVSALAAEESTRCVAGIGGISAVVSKRDRPEVMVAAVTDALPEPAHRRLVRPDDRTQSAEQSQSGRRASLERLRAEAVHASERLAVYRHTMLLGRGDHHVLAQRQRVSRAATDRLRRASQRTASADA
jgi:DNA-binding response OmpR family regulator